MYGACPDMDTEVFFLSEHVVQLVGSTKIYSGLRHKDICGGKGCRAARVSFLLNWHYIYRCGWTAQKTNSFEIFHGCHTASLVPHNIVGGNTCLRRPDHLYGASGKL